MDVTDLEEMVESRSPQLDRSARLTWEDVSLIRDSQGNRQLFYVITGAPRGVGEGWREGKAWFHLRVRNTNSVYNHLDVVTKVRLLNILPQRRFLTPMGWTRFRGSELEDGHSRVIRLEISPATLQAAYNPDSPLTRIETEYIWRESGENYQAHINRTGLDFMLVAPIELLLRRKRRLTQSDIHLNQPGHRDAYWLPVGGINFTDDIRGPVTFELRTSSSVSQSTGRTATASSRQTRSGTRTRTTANTFSLSLSGELSQGGSASASIEILELGITEMFKLGGSMGFSRTTTNTSSTTVAREFSRAVQVSTSYAREQQISTMTRLTIDPREGTAPRGTGGGPSGPSGSSVLIFLYPTVAFFEVPYVRFGGINKMGQATRRTQGTVAVPFVTNWHLTTARN